MTVTALIVAAGPGARLGVGRPKAFVELGGVPLFIRALGAVAATPAVTAAVVVAPPAATDEAEALLRRHAAPSCPCMVLPGGTERQDSVRNGLAAVATELVAIHDAARPFVSRDAVEAAIAAATRHGAAVVGTPATDTIKLVHPDGWVEATPPRERLWLAQTPQVFRTELIRRAHAEAAGEESPATDDAMLVERFGARVHVVRGNPENRKITTLDDLRWARWWLERPAAPR